MQKAEEEKTKKTVREPVKEAPIRISAKERAYVSQGYAGLIHITKSSMGPKYIATSGIVPCIGMTMHLSSDEIISVLVHFDSSNVENIGTYIENLIAKMPSQGEIKITLIPSSASFDFVDIGKGSVLRKDILAGTRTLTQEMLAKLEDEKTLVHMYDLIVHTIAVKKSSPRITLLLAPFSKIMGWEDVFLML